MRALRLWRRDADDPVVMSAVRAERDREVIEVTGVAASVDNVAPIAQLLIEWRHTAEVHADPELHALLSAPRGEDHGPVMPPDPQDGE